MSYATDLQGLVGQIVTVGEASTANQTGTITQVDAADDRLQLSVNGRNAEYQISNITFVQRLT